MSHEAINICFLLDHSNEQSGHELSQLENSFHALPSHHSVSHQSGSQHSAEKNTSPKFKALAVGAAPEEFTADTSKQDVTVTA